MAFAKDTFWNGVNEVIAPNILQDGYLSYGRNIRCEDGKIKTRGGHQTVVITNEATSGGGIPSGFLLESGFELLMEDGGRLLLEGGTSGASYLPESLGAVYGVVDYVGASGQRFTMAFCANNAYLCKFGSHRKAIAYPDGVTISSPVQAFQAEDEVRVMRGNGLIPMRWDASMASFELVEQSEIGSGYARMASGQFGLYFYNRIWVLEDDTVKPSLVGEFDIYDTAKELQADTGTNDVGTGLYVYDKSTIIVTKKKSVYAIVNITDDLEYMELIRISDTIGCESPLGVFTDGAQLYLPTTNGIYPISQAFDTRLQASSSAMTEPIRKSFDAIDFSRFSECAGIAHNGYYYLSIPMQLDGNNSRVLVYSIKNKEWMGFDESASDFDVRGWTKLEIGGEMVLAAVSKSGYIYLYGWNNDLYDGYGSANADTAVSAVAISRGYNYASEQSIRHNSIFIDRSSINAKYSVGYRLDGVEESATVSADVIPSPTRYSVVGKTDFDGTNQYGDFLNPHRGDYSLFSTEDGYQLENDTNNLTYIYLDKLQSSQHKVKVNKIGTFLQVMIEVKRGYLEASSIVVDSDGAGLTYTKDKTI